MENIVTLLALLLSFLSFIAAAFLFWVSRCDMPKTLGLKSSLFHGSCVREHIDQQAALYTHMGQRSQVTASLRLLADKITEQEGEGWILVIHASGIAWVNRHTGESETVRLQTTNIRTLADLYLTRNNPDLS